MKQACEVCKIRSSQVDGDGEGVGISLAFVFISVYQRDTARRDYDDDGQHTRTRRLPEGARYE